MTKKILIIIVIILVLSIIGVFVFFLIPSSSDNGDGSNSSGSGGGFIFGIFGGGDDGGGDDFEGGVPGIGIEKPLLKLRKISDTHTSGFVAFEDEDEVFVRYTERATGHVYEARTTQSTVKRITNTTIPRIYEAVWVGKNSSIIRYLDDENNIKSFYAEVAESGEESSEEGKIEGVFLKDNIREVISYGDKVLNLLNFNGGTQFVVSDLDGSNGFEIFKTPLSEILIQRPKVGTVAITTKATSHSIGYLFFLNTNTGSFSKILERVKGLTTLVDSSAENILYGEQLDLNLWSVEDKINQNLRREGLPEKCVWTTNSSALYCGIPKEIPSGEYPDDWYQGLTSFSDDIYRIDLDDRSIKLVISPEAFSGESIDIIKPTLGPNEEFLFFMNKKDLSLWSLDLREDKPTETIEDSSVGEEVSTTTEEVLE